MKKILTNLEILCTTKIGMTLKKLKTPIKYVNTFSFPKSEVKVKFKSDQSPWITKGIVKLSKKKQRLYENFLKNRKPKNEETYKTYKNLFETIKK